MLRRIAPLRRGTVAKADVFQMQKVSICGNQIKREAVKYLTLEECNDEERFPLGIQTDRKGTYIWQRSIIE